MRKVVVFTLMLLCIFSLPISTHAKDKTADISYLENYKIVKEESSKYKALTDKLSSYTSQELEKLPLVVRREYRVVVPEGLPEGDIKNVVKNIIDNKLRGNNDIDEMIIFIYDDERDADSFYTVGKAVWAVNGKLGNVTPYIASSNDKSKHSISFHIKDRETISGKPTDRELEIYYAHHKALWKDATIPEDVVASNTAKKFGITPDEVDRIYKKVTIWKLGGKKSNTISSSPPKKTECKPVYTKLNFTTIEQVSSDEIKVVAETDLPEGLEFFVKIKKYGMEPNDLYVGTDSKRIKVKDGKINVIMKMYSYHREFLPTGYYQVSLFTSSYWYYRKKEIGKMTPEQEKICAKIGDFGEYIKIEQCTGVFRDKFVTVELLSDKFQFPSRK